MFDGIVGVLKNFANFTGKHLCRVKYETKSLIYVAAVLSDKTIIVSDIIKCVQIILKHVIKLYVKF